MIYTLVREDNNGKVDTIMSFDSVVSFDESYSATVTSQTVEQGFDISDSINIDPTSFDIQAVLCAYSLFDTEREIVWSGEDFNIKSEVSKNTFNHIAARDKLISIFKAKSILTILESSANSSSKNLDTQHSELKSGHFNETRNCIITSLSISTPDSSTGAFMVNLKLQSIIVAVVTQIDLPEGAMLKSLIPYNIKTTNTGSDSGKSESDGDGSPDDFISEAEELSGDVPESAVTGRTQRQFDSKAAKTKAVLETEQKALKYAEELEKRTMRGVFVEKVGDGYLVDYS